MRSIRNEAADLIGAALRGLWRLVALPVMLLAGALVWSCFAPGGCLGPSDGGAEGETSFLGVPADRAIEGMTLAEAERACHARSD